MSDYSKITNFLSKDSLSLNDPAKYVKGSEIDAEYNAIAVAIATKADTASPTLTTPTMSSPTITGTITASIANFSGLVTAALGLTVSGAAFNSRGITDNATAKALTLSGSGANSITIANSATNPTIGTSAGGLQLTPSLVVMSTTSIGALLGINKELLINADAAGVPALSFAVNGTLAGYVSATASGMTITSTAAIPININTNQVTQIRISHTASADRIITLTGSNGGNPTIGTSAGALNIAPGGSLGLSVSAIDSAVNYLSVLPSVLGDAFVSLSTQGSATNITMNLLGKGSGAVAIGSPVTFAAQTVGTTVGAAGGASALPATPLGYLTTSINGTACKIPYYVV